jgi:hypothetical protein
LIIYIFFRKNENKTFAKKTKKKSQGILNEMFFEFFQRNCRKWIDYFDSLHLIKKIIKVSVCAAVLQDYKRSATCRCSVKETNSKTTTGNTKSRNANCKTVLQL